MNRHLTRLRSRVASTVGVIQRRGRGGSWCYRQVMPGLRVVSGTVAAGLVAAGAAATAQATIRHGRVVAEVHRRLADITHQRLGDIGTVDTLRVLPLVDRRGQRPRLRGGPR